METLFKGKIIIVNFEIASGNTQNKTKMIKPKYKEYSFVNV
jgi:hypothetical protein